MQPHRKTAAVRWINPQQQAKQGGLSLAGNTSNRHKFPGTDGAAHLLQNRLCVSVIAKLHIFQPKLRQNAAIPFPTNCAGLLRKGQQLPDSLGRADCGIGLPRQPGDTGDRPLHLIDQLEHGCQHSVGDLSPVDAHTAPQQAQQPRQLKDQVDSVIHGSVEIAFFPLDCCKMVLFFSHLPLHPFPGAAGLHQQQVFQGFLKRCVILCLRLLYNSVSRLQGALHQDNQRQPQQAAGHQHHRKPPVHANQENCGTEEADCHGYHARQDLQNPIFHYRNVRQDPAHQLAAVKCRQTGILLFHQLSEHHLPQTFLQIRVYPDGQNTNPQR